MTIRTKRSAAKRLSFALVATFAVLAVSSSAGAQSSLGRFHFYKMHHRVDCDCIDWGTWALHRSPDFTVKVSFRREPIGGAKVTLTSVDPSPETGEHFTASAITEVDGVAQFYAVPPGKYIAHVNQGLLAQSQNVSVEAGSNNSGELRLQWPTEPIATRSVRGWISAWERTSPQNRSQQIPLSDVQVQLFDLRSGDLVESTQTTKDGYYEFPDHTRGLYVVRVNEGHYPEMKGYDEAVEVANTAAREQMPVLVVDHLCDGGLSTQRSNTPELCIPPGVDIPPMRHYGPYIIHPSTVVVMMQQVVILR